MPKSCDDLKFKQKIKDIIPFILKDKPKDPKKIGKLLFDNYVYTKLLNFYQRLKLNWEYHAQRKQFCCVQTTWKLSGNCKKITFSPRESLILYQHFNANTYLNKVITSGIIYFRKCRISKNSCDNCYCIN